MRHAWLSLILILLCGSPAFAAIAIDGTCTVSGATTDFGDDTFSHTTGASANFLTVCTHTYQATGDVNTIAGITHNGNALTALLSAGTGANSHVELWSRFGALGAGSFTVVVDATADPYFINVACSFSGVAQSTPTHMQTATSTASTLSATVTSATGELALACSVVNPIPVTITEGLGETELWNTAHDNVQAFGSTMAGAAPNVTPDLTLDTSYFSAMAVVSLEPLAVAVGRRAIGPIPFP